MIKFFLDPKRLKFLLLGGGLLLLAFAGLIITTVSLQGRLDSERANHKLTHEKLTVAVREGQRWENIAKTKEANIAALQKQVRACLAQAEQSRQDALEREQIIRQAKPTQPPVGDSKGVMDEATRQRIATRLNRPI